MGCITSKKQASIIPIIKITNNQTPIQSKANSRTALNQSSSVNTLSTVPKTPTRNRNPSFSDFLLPQQDAIASVNDTGKSSPADTSPNLKVHKTPKKSLLDSIHEQIQKDYQIAKEKRLRERERAATVCLKNDRPYQIRVNGELVAESTAVPNRTSEGNQPAAIRTRARTGSLVGAVPNRQSQGEPRKEENRSPNKIRAKKIITNNDSTTDNQSESNNTRQSSIDLTRMNTPERFRPTPEKNLLLQVPIFTRSISE